MTPNQPCILLVEPDLLVRQPLSEYLRECGYKVLEAIDTDEALMILIHCDVTIDIVISDVRSSGQFDGFGLARWINTEKPGLKVILAGSVEKTSETAADLCEHGPIMTKPYHHQLLLEEIKRALAARERLERKSGV